jgi:glyoxylase-like metal-dependent hydrolase (beta-lactamase superfamily II)
MQRRTFLKNCTLLGAYPFIGGSRLSIFDGPTPSDVVRIDLGTFKCTLFQDLVFKYNATDFFTNADNAELKKSLDAHGVGSGTIPSPFIAVLLQQDSKKILIDTGIGFSEKPVNVKGTSLVLKGRLHHLLQQEGISKEEITDVVITHFHPDHIGGIFSEEAKLNFPNARFHMHEDEWAYWHSSQSDNQPGQFKFFIEKNITPLKEGNLHLVKGDFVELLPGITAVKADGHTPGQIALEIQSAKQHLLYASDAFLHPLHIEHLDWRTNYDLDHEKAKISRSKLLDLAYKENMLINAFHFDFPGLGRVDRHHGNWKWRYQIK